MTGGTGFPQRPEVQEIPLDGGGSVHLTLPHNDTYGHFDLSVIAAQGVSAAAYLTRDEVECLLSLLVDSLEETRDA